MQISFCFCKSCTCLKILETIQISVNMIDKLILLMDTQWNVILSLIQLFLSMQRQMLHEEKFENVMFYDFIYLAKGFRMRSKVWSTLSLYIYMYHNMGPVKRICVFEHSVMTNFNCACPAIQKGQGSGFLSEGSS